MKKLIMLVATAFICMSASSQEVFKNVSKTKDYDEAAQILNSSLSGMTAEEKAKCYNYLVDLSYEKIVKEQAIMTENQLNEQMKKKVSPFDTVGFYNAMLKAYQDIQLCDEFDNQPNEKGKVKPAFRKKNAERFFPIRYHLINGGVYYQSIDDALSYKCLATYVESANYPVFDETTKPVDENLGQIAFYAARDAYLTQDYASAEKYADIAMQDESTAKDAMQVKLAVMQAELNSHEDSIAYVNKLKDIYASDESNEMIFSTLCQMLVAVNDLDGMDALVQQKLAQDPNNLTALLLKGQANYEKHNWDNAIADFTKATEVQPENIAVIALIGNSYMYKAKEMAEIAQNAGSLTSDQENEIIGIYKEAITWLEKAKDLDVVKEFKSYWAYPLYNCCYVVYGEDDAKTIAAQSNMQ
ncbi:MAG: hypothetical protein LUC88_02375 [Prevotella sp.]|nr:hypothetical protein [Prevotella sp.]